MYFKVIQIKLYL